MDRHELGDLVSATAGLVPAQCAPGRLFEPVAEDCSQEGGGYC